MDGSGVGSRLHFYQYPTYIYEEFLILKRDMEQEVSPPYQPTNQSNQLLTEEKRRQQKDKLDMFFAAPLYYTTTMCVVIC